MVEPERQGRMSEDRIEALEAKVGEIGAMLNALLRKMGIEKAEPPRANAPSVRPMVAAPFDVARALRLMADEQTGFVPDVVVEALELAGIDIDGRALAFAEANEEVEKIRTKLKSAIGARDSAGMRAAELENRLLKLAKGEKVTA